jgi:S-adenosylmethionine decarboxylase
MKHMNSPVTDSRIVQSKTVNPIFKGDLKKEYEQQQAWGLLTSIDLHDCDPKTLRDAAKVKEHALKVVEMIKARPFGECQVIHFGGTEEVEGFSMVQLIDTSLVSGHYANKTNRVFLDVFSCKFYDPEEVLAYSKKFFGAKTFHVNCVLRK